MVDLKTLRQLIKLMAENDLTELDVEDPKGEKIKLKRGYDASLAPAVLSVPQASTSSPAVQTDSPALATDGLVAINSPMVGTFYAAPNPDESAFVSVGAKVSAETLVCIIEAMKVFNEIKAEVSGTIEQVLVETGQAVEFGQPLFMVKKS